MEIEGNWRPRLRNHLQEMIYGTTASERQLAVFDFDNTCIAGDIGEGFGQYLFETMRYRYDLDAFWEQIAEEDGRRQLRHWTRRALDVDAQYRRESAAYRRYLVEASKVYPRRLKREGKRNCYEWAVGLHVGLTQRQMFNWSSDAIQRELTSERGVEQLRSDDGQQVVIERGIRILDEIKQLIDVLHRAGWEVWIVSASNRWTIEVVAPIFGISADRALGNRVEVDGDVLTSTTGSPVLFREGKAAAIDQFIGHRPQLVVGDAVTDLEMLCMAEECAVVIDCGDERLRQEGQHRDWYFQPQTELTTRGPTDGELARLQRDQQDVT